LLATRFAALSRLQPFMSIVTVVVADVNRRVRRARCQQRMINATVTGRSD
jgi:hypothetical protein